MSTSFISEKKSKVHSVEDHYYGQLRAEDHSFQRVFGFGISLRMAKRRCSLQVEVVEFARKARPNPTVEKMNLVVVEKKSHLPSPSSTRFG
jgi:hypothetical protein